MKQIHEPSMIWQQNNGQTYQSDDQITNQNRPWTLCEDTNFLHKNYLLTAMSAVLTLLVWASYPVSVTSATKKQSSPQKTMRMVMENPFMTWSNNNDVSLEGAIISSSQVKNAEP